MSNLGIENLSRNISVGAPDFERTTRDLSEKTLVGGAGESQGAGGAANGASFSDMLRQSVEQVNQDQQQADTAIKELVAGRTKNIHETMLTIEKADMSLKLMMQVRNKILDAYREIMRMQV